MGIDWLLHIDIDEALFLKGAQMMEHVELLSSAGKETAIYYNYEAIPEQMEVEDYFKEVKLFKKPIKLLQKQNIARSGVWPQGRKYFNFYNNGKSLTKVIPGVYPLGAHRWAHFDRPLNAVQFFNPCVLHYSVCGLSKSTVTGGISAISESTKTCAKAALPWIWTPVMRL